MPAEHAVDLLTDLALILCVAAVTTTVFQRLRQPVVLGYLLAGVVVGPHLPVPLFVNEGADAHAVRAGRRAADVLPRPRLQPAQADQGGADGGHRGGHPVQLHALGRLPGRPAVRLDGLRGAVRRRGAVDLQHHHHRQGVRRTEHQGPPGRDRVRHPHRRGPDRDRAAHHPDRGRVGRRSVRQRARPDRRQAGRLPGRVAGRGDVDRSRA